GVIVVFFFQAEDGIRDLTVTGVQTCALPICFRRISSAGWTTYAVSVLDDRLAGDAARRRLASKPPVHGRADVGELAFVDAAVGVLPFDVGEQQRVLARMVARRRRRVAAVVGGEDEQVLR